MLPTKWMLTIVDNILRKLRNLFTAICLRFLNTVDTFVKLSVSRIYHTIFKKL